MTDTLTRKYQRTEFASGALQDAYESIREVLDGEGWVFNITADYADNEGTTTRKRLSASDLSAITNMSGSPKSLSFECFRDIQSQTLILLQGWSDCLYLVTSAKDSDQCRELNEVFVDKLGLQAVTKVTSAQSETVRAKSSAVPLREVCEQMPLTGWLCFAVAVIIAFVLGMFVG